MKRNKNLPLRPIKERIIDIGEIKIISLGSSCWSRTLPERFHLFDFKQNREVRMPFDGCTTPYSALCELIESNFECVYNGIRLENAEDGEILVTDFGTRYNHEYNTDIDQFKSQMDKRVEQFENELKIAQNENKIILFSLSIFNWWGLDHSVEYPTELVDIFLKMYQNLNFKILCIDANIYKTPVEEKNSDFYRYINVPKPEEKFDLFKKRETTKGKIFEKKSVGAFLNFISEFTNKQYDVNEIFANRAWDVY